MNANIEEILNIIDLIYKRKININILIQKEYKEGVKSKSKSKSKLESGQLSEEELGKYDLLMPFM